MWNDAEAPEPPANLTATVRGAVIHRFCERFQEGDDLEDCLKQSFDEIVKRTAAELGDRALEINSEKAVWELMPLARNYAASRVRERIESVRGITSTTQIAHHAIGVLSEQRFRLRRPLGILTGTIDKLLMFPSEDGKGINAEIIDFKTNRFRGRAFIGTTPDQRRLADADQPSNRKAKVKALRRQLSFEFLRPASDDRDLLMQAEIEAAALDYRIQMQSYALAARYLIPDVASVRVTLHFLDPDVEISLPDELLQREACESAIDTTMMALVSSASAESFPFKPAEHCRMCNFVQMCSPGRNWLSQELG